jgi:hypothetical protein
MSPDQRAYVRSIPLLQRKRSDCTVDGCEARQWLRADALGGSVHCRAKCECARTVLVKCIDAVHLALSTQLKIFFAR